MQEKSLTVTYKLLAIIKKHGKMEGPKFLSEVSLFGTGWHTQKDRFERYKAAEIIDYQNRSGVPDYIEWIYKKEEK